MADKFDLLLEELQKLTRETAGFHVEIEKVNQSVGLLFKIINGNGIGDGLTTRLRLIEERVRTMDESMKELVLSREESRSADTTGRWMFWAAVVSGFAGLVAGIIALFVHTAV